MARMVLAFKAFFRILFDATSGEKVRHLLEGGEEPAVESPALTLLATLQREARLVDFLKEDIGGYSDEQVGAAVRDLHRDAAATVDRIFGLETLRREAEDSPVVIHHDYRPSEVRLTGNVTGKPPYRGTLRHGGWKATRCEVPARTASEMVVAPAEVELS